MSPIAKLTCRGLPSDASSINEDVKDIACRERTDPDGGAPAGKSAVNAVDENASPVADRFGPAAKTKVRYEELGKLKT